MEWCRESPHASEHGELVVETARKPRLTETRSSASAGKACPRISH